MTDELVCWRCGDSLAQLTLPLGRLDECPSCGNYVHVCVMCAFYDPSVAKSCREDDAEEVKEKKRPNFCDYFKPRPDAYDAIQGAQTGRARAELAALFGGAEFVDEETMDGDGSSDADEALIQAESLFGSGGTKKSRKKATKKAAKKKATKAKTKSKAVKKKAAKKKKKKSKKP